MERNASPVSNAESLVAPSPPRSPTQEDQGSEVTEARKKKGARKKRKTAIAAEEGADADQAPVRKHKKPKQRRKDKDESRPKKRKQGRKAIDRDSGLTAAQQAVNEQMRRALEEDQYSANGSIVDTDSDGDDQQYVYKGQSVRLDRNYLVQAARKHLWLGRGGGPNVSASKKSDDNDETDSRRGGRKKKKGKRSKDENHVSSLKDRSDNDMSSGIGGTCIKVNDNDYERDEGSIFGQTTGSSNSTWVECDKCKKWRRLRGVVDERKLPPKWYCSMNKNDPERARCSAPEEEYDASNTPENAADSRTRKHFRVWVRRLQCNEAYESRQPTLTRGKKRAAASSSKEPYEWIRCCNPSCGKWRAILRIMDAKTHVIERTADGEWFCVMNTWDEKTASCAAPQENLPAVGCPPWVMQDEN